MTKSISKMLAQLNDSEHQLSVNGWFAVTECPSGGFYLHCDDMQVSWAATQAELEEQIYGENA